MAAGNALPDGHLNTRTYAINQARHDNGQLSFRIQCGFEGELKDEKWMNTSEICQLFDKLIICSVPAQKYSILWDSLFEPGKDGGCYNFPAWNTNPILGFRAQTSGILHASVMREDPRKTNGGVGNWATLDSRMGFVIYHSTDGQPYKQLSQGDSVCISGPWDYVRDAHGSFQLEAGRTYYIVPSTYTPHRHFKFRVLLQADCLIDVVTAVEGAVVDGNPFQSTMNQACFSEDKIPLVCAIYLPHPKGSWPLRFKLGSLRCCWIYHLLVAD